MGVLVGGSIATDAFAAEHLVREREGAIEVVVSGLLEHQLEAAFVYISVEVSYPGDALEVVLPCDMNWAPTGELRTDSYPVAGTSTIVLTAVPSEVRLHVEHRTTQCSNTSRLGVLVSAL